MTKPIISTPQAVKGIHSGVNKVLEIEENPLKFAQKVIGCLNNPIKTRGLGNSASAFVKLHHNWEKNLTELFES